MIHLVGVIVRDLLSDVLIEGLYSQNMFTAYAFVISGPIKVKQNKSPDFVK